MRKGDLHFAPSLHSSVAPCSSGEVHRHLRPRLAQHLDHLDPLLAAPSVVACEDKGREAVRRVRLVVSAVVQELVDNRLVALRSGDVLRQEGWERRAGRRVTGGGVAC